MVRLKNRYFLVEILFPSSLPFAMNTTVPPPPQLSESMLVNILRESLLVNFGEVGWAEVGGSLNGAESTSRLGRHHS